MANCVQIPNHPNHALHPTSSPIMSEKYYKGPRCGYDGCPSRKYYDDETGMPICQNGHEKPELRKKGGNDEDAQLASSQGRTTRKKTESQGRTLKRKSNNLHSFGETVVSNFKELGKSWRSCHDLSVLTVPNDCTQILKAKKLSNFFWSLTSLCCESKYGGW